MNYSDRIADEIQEIRNFKGFLKKCPFLTVVLIFLGVLAAGGLLRMSFAIFTILALAGGFALPIIYGARIGLAPYESIILCLGIYTYVSYSSLCILRSMETHVKVRPHLGSLKTRFRPVYRVLVHRAGGIGIHGILFLVTFLVGWWLAVVLAFMSDLEVHDAMAGIFGGLVGGGLLTWALYFGIGGSVSNPFVLAAIFMGIGLATGAISNTVISRIRRRRRSVIKKRSRV